MHELTDSYRKLGALSVSPLGLGTVKFGRNTAVKYPAAFALPSDRAITRLLDLASELGINLLDTAPAYGTAESRLGQLMGNRHRWILSTKVGESYDGTVSHFDFSKKTLQQSIGSSLRQLGTDYLDILLIHCSDDDLANLQHTDAIPVLQESKRAGLVRCIGASTKTVSAGLFALEHLDVAMVSYNGADVSQAPVLHAARTAGKSVIIKKVLASGHSSNRSRDLKAALDQPGVASVVIGTLDESHLKENVSSALFALS